MVRIGYLQKTLRISWFPEFFAFKDCFLTNLKEIF
ncbi:hypothetical protein LRU_00622 [Ligilactobacillus ruminis SPM0211]|uniref:Uncharacterized protein n=1 Tax=Ligilactobacillus ruminis SPM0211 TaxID=1040964 RepID=F7QYY1_9LACO|nr:hypothetical protein LRU_00622 [Ligilactobacillus ruminis SPM0211]